MTKYDKLPDNLIIELVRQGDREAEEYMLLKYSNMVNSEVRFLYLAGADMEDLAQEGMIGLFTAIRDYDPESNASFSTFANICIKNKVYSAITNANRQKNLPLNSYVSLFYDQEDEGAGEKLYMSDNGEGDPENIVLRHEQIEQMYKDMDMKLSPMEKKVAKLYIDGLSRKEISEFVGKSEKSVDNAITRIHNKMRD